MKNVTFRQPLNSSQNPESRRASITGQLIILLASLSVIGAFLLIYMTLFPARQKYDMPDPYSDYDPSSMHESVSPENLKNPHQKITGFGSRFLGQEGFYKTQAYLKETFEAAGLEIYEHDIDSIAPQTAFREIYRVVEPDNREQDERLQDVEIFPFHPNHMQPVVTPEEGVTGKLIVLNTETLKNHRDFKNCIGIIDAREGAFDKSSRFNWLRYARLGLKGIVVANPDGLKDVLWISVLDEKFGMVTSVPVNFLRVGASREIFNYVGQTVRIRARADFKKIRHKSLFAVLRAPRPATEAIILTSFYDAESAFADRAPGITQAVSPVMQIQLMKGLLAYRDTLKRDVIFANFGCRVMAEDSLNNLIRILGPNKSAKHNVSLFATSEELEDENSRSGESDSAESTNVKSTRVLANTKYVNENEERFSKVKILRQALGKPQFLETVGATEETMDDWDKPTRSYFKDQFSYVLNQLVFELNEPMLKAKIEFEKNPDPDPLNPVFQKYQKARKVYEKASAAAGYSVINLMNKKRSFFDDFAIRERFVARLDELREYHEFKAHQLDQEAALVGLFDSYRNVGNLEVKLMPAFEASTRREIISIDDGRTNSGPESPAMVGLMAQAKEKLGLREITVPPFDRWQNRKVGSNLSKDSRKSTFIWSQWGYPSYTFINFERLQSYERWFDPSDMEYMHDLESMRESLAVVGEVVLSMAHGNGRIDPIPQDANQLRDYKGRVLAGGIGQSIVPTFPLKNAILGARSHYETGHYSWPGKFRHLFYYTNPYGEFELPNCASDFISYNYMWSDSNGVTLIAASYGEDGLIQYMKDEGKEGQRQFKSIRVNFFSLDKLKDITLVCFRAAPIALLDVTNPQTLKDFTGVQLLDRDSMVEFPKQCMFRCPGVEAAFIEPDERVYLTLKSGAPHNELVQVTRAFMLNVDNPLEDRGRREIEGDGYLVADTPYILDVPFEISKSMLSVNHKRLELQNAYHMADNRTNEYHEKAIARLKSAGSTDESYFEANRQASEAVVYTSLNHPVLRESIFEAVLGIIWYLALLVPFGFFFEKLVFGYTDIRKQLTAQAVIFVVVFILLRLLHPAFQMVRSSIMILLGFIIILISAGVTFLFSGKFQENLEELRKKQGKVSAAEVNKAGVMISAFMLGLNNMHRRKVRTGLTCATLTLITFVMISFTSVNNDLVDESKALGKAPYQGLLIKKEEFNRVENTEIFSIKNRYSDSYDVCERNVYLGYQTWEDKSRYNPNLEIVYRDKDTTKKVDFDSIMQFNAREPLRDKVKFLTNNTWFTEEHEDESYIPCPIFIPREMAERLGLTIPAVNRGEDTDVIVNGRTFKVMGIFESESVENLRDIDGLDLLPFDVESIPVAESTQNWVLLANEDDPRIAAKDLIIAPNRDLRITVLGEKRAVSVAVSMPDASFKAAKAEIENFMEQTGQKVFYGLDGVAYKGKRTRETTLAGLIDLLIPLIIAGLTVLNTMKGSVYERHDEIYVYNSVGIAPKYIFFMFIAESLVYVVVGSVLGYLLSQGTGRILTIVGLTGGLNMTFTSVTTIYASLTIAAAVLASTWFPARTAMEISAPTEDAGWSLPEPVGDLLEFDLPFNFTRKGRIAVLAFFHRYLTDHGEGGAGRFFAGEPRLGINEELDPVRKGQYIPQISTTIWLKPFDLGVSQLMVISTPSDPETGLYKANIAFHRLSGTRESWMRLNKSLVTLVRRHFLHWRAVSKEERNEMYAEARELMKQHIAEDQESSNENRTTATATT